MTRWRKTILSISIWVSLLLCAALFVAIRDTGRPLHPVFHARGAIFNFLTETPDNTIIIPSDSGVITALNHQAQVRWQVVLRQPAAPSGAIVGSDGTIFFGASDSNAYAYTGAGLAKWTNSTSGAITVAPAFSAYTGAVFVDTTGMIYAFTPDGHLSWKRPCQDEILLQPIVAEDGTIYVATSNILYAVRWDGSPLWNVQLDCPIAYMALGTGKLFLQCADSSLYCIDKQGNHSYRSQSNGKGAAGILIGGDDHVILCSSDGRISVYDCMGTKVSQLTIGVPIDTPPLLSSKMILWFCSANESLYGVSTQALRKFVVHSSRTRRAGIVAPPLIDSAGDLWVATLDGVVYKAPAHDTLANTRWPSIAQNRYRTSHVPRD